MIMPWVLGDFAPEGSPSFDRILQMIDDLEIGGVIVSTGTPLDVAVKLNLYQERSRLPLLVAADLETGAGFRMRGAVFLPGGTDLGGASDFPSLMALGATGNRYLAYEMGRITAEEARGVGIHVPFAPVLDVNSNPLNPIINTRSFGEDPEAVAALGMCFVRGIQDHRAIATGKHFPGHGDTDTDSHLALPIIRSGRDRLDRIELLPFRRAIEAGMGAVMTAHIALPEITEAPNLPSTLSRNVLTGILREEMDFQGLIFTDAMDMGAIDALFSREEAAARAVEAGADILLMPPDPARAVRGVMEAVLSGRLSEERIDASVRRILEAKGELGLHEERRVSAEGVHRRVGIPANVAIAQEIADRSLTLLRNERNLLPLAGSSGANVLSVTYRRTNDLLGGRTFDARLRQTYTRLQTATVGVDTPRETYARLTDLARRADLVIISLHITAVSYAGTVAAPPDLVAFINAISRSGSPNVVVSFGNPYLLNDFPGVQSYLIAWDGAEVSQRAAARALLGEIGTLGKTPIRVPPNFEIGSGLSIAPRVQQRAVLSGEGGCG
jgi:beta-N-acetylhexosaminidase